MIILRLNVELGIGKIGAVTDLHPAHVAAHVQRCKIAGALEGCILNTELVPCKIGHVCIHGKLT